MIDHPPQRPTETRLRLFVAIELPHTWLDALAGAQKRLREGLADAGLADRPRWTRPEGIHLTLKFLGSVGESRRPAVEDALKAAVAAPPNLRLRLGSIGVFPGRGPPRVLWAGIDGDVEPLARLAAQIDAAMSNLGFPRETRPFAAHLTLARLSEGLLPPEREPFAAAVRVTHIGPAPDLLAQGVSLMRSHLGPAGARYERLASFP